MTMSKMRCFEWLRWGMLTSLMASAALGAAQEPANRMQPLSQEMSHESVSDSGREVREQVRELQAAVAGMRSDWQRARTETAELRRELEEVRTETGLRNAVIRNAVVKSATSTASPVPVGGLQNVLENRVPQDQRAEDPKQDRNEDRKEDRKKGEHAASLEEEYQLLSGKVDDQYQTKVDRKSVV